jgi:hypothetical protein
MDTTESPEYAVKVSQKVEQVAKTLVELYTRMRLEDSDQDDRKHLWSSAVTITVAMINTNMFEA